MVENTKLVEYIKASRLSGRTDREIRKTLSDIGWSEEPLNEAFRQVESQSYISPSTTTAPVTSPIGSAVSYDSEPASGRGRLFFLLTIVGLLVVFAVVALVVNLRGSSTSSYSTQTPAIRDQKRESDVKKYAEALGKYIKDHNRYPAVSGAGLDSTDGGAAGIFDKSGALKPYLKSFATDPKNGQSLCQVNASTQDTHCAYKYRVSADGKTFVVWAVLEKSYNNSGVYTVDSSGKHLLVGGEPKTAP